MKSKAKMDVEQKMVISKTMLVLGVFCFIVTELPFSIMKYLVERQAFIHWLLQIGSLFLIIYFGRLNKRLKKYQKYPILERYNNLEEADERNRLIDSLANAKTYVLIIWFDLALGFVFRFFSVERWVVNLLFAKVAIGLLVQHLYAKKMKQEM